MNSILNQNLEFLTAHASQNTIDCILQADPDESSLHVETEDEHSIHFCRKSANDEQVFIHSRRDPNREAERQILDWDTRENVDWSSLIVVFGVAGLYHLAVLMRGDPSRPG